MRCGRTAGHSSSDLHGKSLDAHHHSLVPPHSTSGITVHSLLKSPSPRVLFESDNSHHNHRRYELYRSAAHGRRLKGTFPIATSVKLSIRIREDYTQKFARRQFDSRNIAADSVL